MDPITQAFFAHGFEFVHTGGNCTAYERTREGVTVFVTDGDASAPEAAADDCVVQIYRGREHGDGFSMYFTAAQFLASLGEEPAAVVPDATPDACAAALRAREFEYVATGPEDQVWHWRRYMGDSPDRGDTRTGTMLNVHGNAGLDEPFTLEIWDDETRSGLALVVPSLRRFLDDFNTWTMPPGAPARTRS